MPINAGQAVPRSTEPRDFTIRFPERLPGCDQDEEWFEVLLDGEWRRYRLHDYAELFEVPGLYEALVYDTLKCTSPRKLTRLLKEVLDEWPVSLEDLPVLDLGAGNGIVAQHLRSLGAPRVVGVDLLEEARQAAFRDRPDAYDDYLVADLCNLTAEERRQLGKQRFRCLTAVASLGFGDIPPQALAEALKYVSTPGWVGMTLKEDFLTGADPTGFSCFIRRMLAEGVLELEAQFRYCHRRAISGERLLYIALVGRKLQDVPVSLLDNLDAAEAVLGEDTIPLVSDTLAASPSDTADT